MDKATYEIGDREYCQEELVLCQEEALAELIYPLLEDANVTAKRMVEVLLVEKRALRKALAVVLIPVGESVESRDLDAVEAHLAAHMKLSTQGEVIRDFLEINAGAAKELMALGSQAKAGTAPPPQAPQRTPRSAN